MTAIAISDGWFRRESKWTRIIVIGEKHFAAQMRF